MNKSKIKHCSICGCRSEDNGQLECPCGKPESSIHSADLLSAIELIKDGIESVDFILNYGRGTKSRTLKIWLNKANKFIKSLKKEKI
jgi:hypothetical protein